MTKTYTMPTWEEFVAMMVAPERDYIGGGGIGPLAEYVRNSMVRIDRTPYETIREALAVEGQSITITEAMVKIGAETIEYWTETTNDPSLLARKVFEAMWTQRHMASIGLVPPESERLVGAARGESIVQPQDWNEAHVTQHGGEAWADVGGGEEKPVRNVGEPLQFGSVVCERTGRIFKSQLALPNETKRCGCDMAACRMQQPELYEPPGPEPVADHPRCGNCKFWSARTDGTAHMGGGYCRRFPPRFEVEQALNDGWPMVAQVSWCGEWRAK